MNNIIIAASLWFAIGMVYTLCLWARDPLGELRQGLKPEDDVFAWLCTVALFSVIAPILLIRNLSL